jgi:hypothetical protein
MPLAVLVLGKHRGMEEADPAGTISMPIYHWIQRLALAAASYVILYWLAGYFIAWQNPELRAFYTGKQEIMPFWQHTITSIRNEPWFLPMQALRGMIWTACALPIIYGSKSKTWGTAALVGLFFSVPQNLGHIFENPLIPFACIRMSHMIETASSTFIFGLVVVWLIHAKEKLHEVNQVQ